MKPLIVPSNMALQWELFPGFGKKELFRTGIVTGIAAIVMYVGFLLGLWNAIIAITGSILVLAVAVQLFARTIFNTSMYDQMMMAFNKGEKGQTYFMNKKEEVQIFVVEEETGTAG